MITKRLLLALVAIITLTLFCGATTHAKGGSMELEAQLIWGTNDDKSPDPNHKEIDAPLAKKLSKTPYKWKNYFEVNRQKTSLAPGIAHKMTMSKECELEVKNLGDGRIEVKLFGNKNPVSRNTESLPPGKTLILGGDAKNDTAWLIVIKRTDSQK
jgi:hypothetical protein